MPWRKTRTFLKARHQLAEAYMAAGKFDQASRNFQKLIRMDPSHTKFQLELARSYLYANKATDALNEVESLYRGSSSQPWSARNSWLCSYVNRKSGRLEKRTSYRLNRPCKAISKLGLAAIYERRGKTADAEALAQWCNRSDEKNIKSLLHALASLQLLWQSEISTATYKKIMQISPVIVMRLYHYGSCMSRQRLRQS